MPGSYSWPLIAEPPIGGIVEADITAAPVLPCYITAYTQQEILDLFDRILPEHYLAPIKDPGPGYELLECYAKLFSRVSEAVQKLSCAAYILSSKEGAYATGEVELYRPSEHPEAISITVKQGTVLEASRSGRRFVTVEDVTFGPTDLGPFVVGVQSVAQGYEYNLPGLVVSADGTTLTGEIDTIVVLVEDPEVSDLTISVRQTGAATSGGVDASLNQQGLDRGLARIQGETESAYRARIRTLPDNISPSAIERVLQQQLLAYIGPTYQFTETFDVAYQTCWDGPPDTIGASSYDSNLFCYDDPDSDGVPFRNRWLDESDHRGAFIVVVPALLPFTDTGMVYDDTALNAVSLSNANGQRAVSAWDVTSAQGGGHLQGGYDGNDIPKNAVYKRLFDTLQVVKAAGVSASVELFGE